MYDTSDPRANLATAARQVARPTDPFAGPEFGLFYKDPPQEEDDSQTSWFLRGQNFIIAYTDARQGAHLDRAAQPDEYMVLLPDREAGAIAECGADRVAVDGFSLIIMPPGDTRLTLPDGGRVIRLFSARARDLVEKCPNQASYAEQRPNIPEFEAWPEPIGGFRIRPYSLDVPDQPGRFGKIWRCTTMMVNYFAPHMGPRDATKMSPHFHDDFEQCSLALEGSFVHHLRWSWTPDMTKWRDDLHAPVESPSATVIPPPVIHTTRASGEHANLLVDIFSPPRMDFSLKEGWVLNADEYPIPEAAPAA